MEQHRRNCEADWRISLKESWLWTWCGLLAQSVPKQPEGQLVRLVVGQWLVFSFVLTIVYRCVLKAMLILPRVHLPFDNLEQLVHTGIHVAVGEGTSIHVEIMRAADTSSVGQLRDVVVPVPAKQTKLYNLKVMEGHLAGMRTRTVANFIVNDDFAMAGVCRAYIMSRGFFGPNILSIAFPKGSPLKPKFDSIILGGNQPSCCSCSCQSVSLSHSSRMVGTAAVVMAAVPMVIVAIFVVFGWVYRLRSGQANTSVSLKGKTIIVTGASAGIGKEAARDFARRGARVIMACRNLQKASKVASDIEASTGSKSVVVRELDTSSLSSVRSFAARILAEERRLDVLVLNAGIGGPAERVLTSDNLELTMATNHFGHFLLANLLLGLLKDSQPSRVVVVASMAHNGVKTLDIENLNFKHEGSFKTMKAYSQTKACNILFARQLAAMLKDSGVVVNSLCPGLVLTEIFDKSNGLVLKYLLNFAANIAGKTPEQGAQTIIHLAVSEDTATISGEFFENCKVAKVATDLVLDDGMAKKLWEASETLVGLQPEERHY
ncbi:retinol dehydrogenase 11-like isoform X2 [Portunus trituberculatus]|nr:retinol dehydrogenase 11-like isoform X2 [Portunus trituberculatus]